MWAELVAATLETLNQGNPDGMEMAPANTRSIELRSTRRYGLNTPVLFCWATSNASAVNSEGRTRDINAAGAYIYAKNAPPDRARVQVDVILCDVSGRPFGTHLIGEGVVLRVEPEPEIAPEGMTGFAVSVQFYLAKSEERIQRSA